MLALFSQTGDQTMLHELPGIDKSVFIAIPGKYKDSAKFIRYCETLEWEDVIFLIQKDDFSESEKIRANEKHRIFYLSDLPFHEELSKPLFFKLTRDLEAVNVSASYTRPFGHNVLFSKSFDRSWPQNK